MKIYNCTRNTCLAANAERADGFFSRLVGLLPRKQLNADEALVISDCRCIHMLGMRFAIDAVFVDKEIKTVGLVKNIKPYGFSPYFFSSFYVVECPPGTIDRTLTNIGDKLSFEG